MTRRRIPSIPRAALLGLLAVVLIAGAVQVIRIPAQLNRITVVAYFANTNGVFAGDDVRILGVRVGKIEKIEPEPLRAKVTFSYDGSYKVPANANAVILSPSLVTARAIQLTPAYTGGPVLQNRAVIPQDRTAVPVEWDDFRAQLERLTQTLQPTEPGGVAPLGALINRAADNLRGEGASIRDTVIKLSQAISALSDHSHDIFSTVRNLSILVSALQGSSDLMRGLNEKLASVTALVANDPNEVGNAIHDLNTAVDDVGSFVKDNRETLGVTADKATSVAKAITASLDDIKQTLHTGPNVLANFVSTWQPAQGALTGALELPNFNNPINFLCGAIQAASRLNAEQSAKLCVQYLAPIIKNRQYNTLPLGLNLFVGAEARPNEVTYSEDWLRPDYVPTPTGAPGGRDSGDSAAAQSGIAAGPPVGGAPAAPPSPPGDAPTSSAQAVATNPAAGLQGMMVPRGPSS